MMLIDDYTKNAPSEVRKLITELTSDDDSSANAWQALADQMGDFATGRNFLNGLTQLSVNYISHFYQFAQHLMPQIRDDASRILQQIVNPNANTLEELEAEISKALKKISKFKK